MILLPVQFDNYINRNDDSASLRFSTQELTCDQVLELHKVRKSFGYLAFKDENILNAQEIKSIESMKTEFHGKSKSQRLMGVLHVFWNQKDTQYEKFEDFYSAQMESYIQKVKDRLE